MMGYYIYLEGGRYSALALKRFSPAREMDMSWREGREKVVRRCPGKVQFGERTKSWYPFAKVKVVIRQHSMGRF